jgi:FkbM family methyltransferase
VNSPINFKQSAQKLIHSLGWDIHRFDPNSNDYIQLLQSLDHFKIDILFDIGANKGQFSSYLRMFGYEGKIVSFEPLSDAHKILEKTAHTDGKWIVHDRTAIGDFDGKININISGNSQSSSILPMLDTHTSVAEKSAYIGTEEVSISRLDTLLPFYISTKERLFLKIDTQGFEWNVLDGAESTLKKAHGILCELSLVPLYDGQKLWLDVIHRLEQEGFTLWSIKKGFSDPRNGQTLQLDATFFRDCK